MSKRYLTLTGISCLSPKLLFCCLFIFSVTYSFAQSKDSSITTIYTSFKNYWVSGSGALNQVQPDSSHNLLAFTFRNKTYSTGVNNAILNSKLGSGGYISQVYKALPISNIAGNVVSGGATYIATAIKNDGDSTKASYTSPYPNIRIADVLTDGKNGLDLGTGVTNLPKGARISFPIKNLSTKASTDSIPDLVFTQIADPSGTEADTIYFYDIDGKVVGKKKLVYWNTVNKLGTYKLDLYSLQTGVSCNTSSINGVVNSTPTRDIRMVAFLVTEFGITNSDSTAKVKGIMIAPNGTSDQAFIAYNTNILNIDAPVITTQPLSQTFCSISTTSATFEVTVSSNTSLTYQWKKNGAAISGATSSSYTATGLTLADTSNAYSVTVTNSVGSVTSDPAYVKYTLVSHPANQYVAVDSLAKFTVKASGASSYQWYKNGTAIPNATATTYTVPAATLAMSGSSYYVVVGYSGGNCISNTATLIVENLPSVTLQPQQQVICSRLDSSATFSVAASSTSSMAYQWFKNGIVISGATLSSFTANGLTMADTINTYFVQVTNGVGTVKSSSAGFKYLIYKQPLPANALIATGNTMTFGDGSFSSLATAFQWKKDGYDIAGAISSSYKLDTVTTSSTGRYTMKIFYNGGYCITRANVLTASTVLYSKDTGNLNQVGTWGVNQNGSGSSPVDFTRPEHTFIIANRPAGINASNLVITGTYDLADAVTTINAGTSFEAGRIIRSASMGTISVTPTSSLIVHGKSDLYFDAANKTLKNLTISTTDTVTLHSALNITSGKGRGIVRVMSGVFNTGDSLVLKSDSLGTACIGNSPGTITGKVTVEQYIPAHRAWRLFSSPVSDSLAPTIHDAWQEGAVSSSDNPHPGYGTHITYGAVSEGFDQNPQKSFSMKVRNASGQWVGVPATNQTKVTDYPAYFFFIRGNRAYDIEHTSETMASRSTIIRTTGYMKQHAQTGPSVNNSGFTLVSNPYASPVDFESVFHHSSVAQHFYMWNPSLAGDKGVGAYVLVYWNGSGYSTVPALRGADSMRFLQANQGFFVEGNGGTSAIGFDEGDKDTASLITPFGREVAANTPKLEINLNIFNNDSTTSVADGATFLFGNAFNSGIDRDDITKLGNINENAGILSNGKLLAVEQRSMPAEKDSLQLSLSNTKTGSYQLDIIPGKLESINMYLYDKYTGNKTPLSSTDTNHIKIDINTSEEGSKAANRFVIISRVTTPVAVSFAHISATLQPQAIQVDWTVTNENNVSFYTVQRSADGITFNSIANVPASGKQSYSYIDSKPLKGINYYRVQSISRTGAGTFTGVVSEVFSQDVRSYIAVYPNPLTSNHCTLEMYNKTSGKYQLTLVSSEGITVFTSSITISQSTAKQPLLLPASLAKGKYYLRIEGGNKTEVLNLVSLY